MFNGSRIETYRFTHTVGGQPLESVQTSGVIDPATGDIFSRVPVASRADLDVAVSAARAAFTDWSRLSFPERRDRLLALSLRITEQIETLSLVITREQGRPLDGSRWELVAAAKALDEMSSLVVADQVLRDDGRNRISLHYRPLGVVGAITPWNFPIGLAAHKIAQALYSGSTLVLKPSPYTPLSTLLLGELSRDVLPPGVLNTISGDNQLGQWMSEHPGIDKITFTGSVATGKHVLRSVAGTLKRVTLELGGNDPAIMLDDADLETAVPKIFAAAFRNAGQICMAVKRVYVPEALYDEVCQRFVWLANQLPVGHGLDPAARMGPLQNKAQYDKVLEMIEETRHLPGARILAGGMALDRPGYFIAPTIVANLPDDARIVAEEQFGPVLPIVRYASVDEAIARANDSRLGLSASVWTRDLQRGAEVASRLEAGTVWVNQHIDSETTIPFGGFKESGLGREHGIEGLHAYMEAQVINTSLT